MNRLIRKELRRIKQFTRSKEYRDEWNQIWKAVIKEGEMYVWNDKCGFGIWNHGIGLIE